jgi:serine/threonine protein kinase
MQRYGPYTADEKIGQGGMARVFRGTAPDGRQVVIKVSLSRDEAAHARLRDEARVGMRLAHSALVETLDLVESEEGPALIAGFIDGVMLSMLWRSEGALTLPEVAHLGARLAAGLAAVHAAVDEQGQPMNIIHRDVTATNVIVDRSGTPRIIDLGISRSDQNEHTTDMNIVRGTARYLSPEIVVGDPVSQADDVWALGCTILESALGVPVIEGSQPMTILRTVADKNPLDGRESQLPPDLLALLKRVFVPSKRRIDAATLARGFSGLDTRGGAEKLAQRVQHINPPKQKFDVDDMFAKGGTSPEPMPPTGAENPADAVGRDLSAFDFSEVDRDRVEQDKVERPPVSQGPVPSGSLDLDWSVKEKAAEVRQANLEALPTPRDHYPDMNPKRSKAPVVIAVVVVLVVALGGAGFLLRDKLPVDLFGGRKATPKEKVIIERRAEELRGNVAPPCFDAREKMWFVYKGKDGSDVVAKTLGEVPMAQRKTARCVQGF